MPSTAYKRLFLRSAYRARGGLTLKDALLALADARFSDTKSGRVVVGMTLAGQSVQFAPPAGDQLTPVALAEVVSDLIDRYDAAKVKLGGTPTDDQLLSTMLECLNPVKGYRSDYTRLRSR